MRRSSDTGAFSTVSRGVRRERSHGLFLLLQFELRRPAAVRQLRRQWQAIRLQERRSEPRLLLQAVGEHLAAFLHALHPEV